jgi:hypothetical protein
MDLIKIMLIGAIGSIGVAVSLALALALLKRKGVRASAESAASGLHMLRAVMAAIILANVVSCYGQVEWFWRDQHLVLIGAIGAAVSLESIALALSAMAHHAMIAGDSSWSLAGGSRGMSLIAGLINLSHYSPHGITHPTTLGIVFGLLSSSSGFMWGAYAKRQARDKFIEEGVIGKRTVRVGLPMWALYPSEALERLRVGVYFGENRLAEVRRLVEEKRAVKEIEAKAETGDERALREEAEIIAELLDATSKAERVRIAIRRNPALSPAGIVAWLGDRGYDNVDPADRAASERATAYVRNVKSVESRRTAEERRGNVRALPSAGEAT